MKKEALLRTLYISADDIQLYLKNTVSYSSYSFIDINSKFIQKFNRNQEIRVSSNLNKGSNWQVQHYDDINYEHTKH